MKNNNKEAYDCGYNRHWDIGTKIIVTLVTVVALAMASFILTPFITIFIGSILFTPIVKMFGDCSAYEDTEENRARRDTEEKKYAQEDMIESILGDIESFVGSNSDKEIRIVLKVKDGKYDINKIIT